MYPLHTFSLRHGILRECLYLAADQIYILALSGSGTILGSNTRHLSVVTSSRVHRFLGTFSCARTRALSRKYIGIFMIFSFVSLHHVFSFLCRRSYRAIAPHASAPSLAVVVAATVSEAGSPAVTHHVSPRLTVTHLQLTAPRPALRIVTHTLLDR